MSEFKQQCRLYCERVDSTLEAWISAQVLAPRLRDAMNYSVFNGGKRVRPILVFAAAQSLLKRDGLDVQGDLNLGLLESSAAALECIHAYSLVHDDLPAMDDDDLRRGKPTCHIQFDEATAILAGDALQALAFERLADAGEGSACLSVSLLKALALASGAGGMVGGQMLDIEMEGSANVVGLSALECVHKHKTGALIKAAVRMGALCANASEEQLRALDCYAENIGLAFQVQDDILDVVSDTATLGKQQGSDIKNNKCTYVSLLGLEAATGKAQGLVDEAKLAIDSVLPRTTFLKQLADYIVSRTA